MTRMDWKKARKYKGSVEKYTAGTKLPNGRIVKKPEATSLDRRASWAEKAWLKKLNKHKKQDKQFIIAAEKKRVAISGGLDCPKCGRLMQRFEHSHNWGPHPDKYFFRYWDVCRPCKHTQHYEQAKSLPHERVIWGDKWPD
jgi:hypothetical protein